MKRLFDLIVATAGLLVLSPFILILLWIVRRNSEGPAIFRQERVGKNGKTFVCLKIRTMKTGTAHRPTHEIGQSSLTSIGAFLRRAKFDELPQLYNVLLGDMSLVGPRPCLQSQTELIEARRIAGALDVRPGITGLAQVQGVDMSDPARLASIDGQYVRNQNFIGDLTLIWRTIAGSGRGEDHVRSSSPASESPTLGAMNALLEKITGQEKIIVTGASGFVGREFLEIVAQRPQTAIICLMRKPATFISGNCYPLMVTNAEFATSSRELDSLFHNAKAVVHLAAATPASGSDQELTLANVELTKALARLAAKNTAGRFVFISSALVHGEATGSNPVSETSALAAAGPYAISKQQAEEALQDIARESGLNYTIIRPPLVYGPGVRGALRSLARAVAWGLPLPLANFASNRRDVIGLRNLACFIDMALDHPAAANEIFLVSDGAPLSTRALLESMAAGAGKSAHLFPFPTGLLRAAAGLAGAAAPLERLTGNFEVDASKSKKLLGWQVRAAQKFEMQRMMQSL